MGNAAEDALFDAALELLAEVVEAKLLFAAVSELDGPNNCVAPSPPETKPSELVEAP